MQKFFALASVLALVLAQPAWAQAVEDTVTAPNGLTVAVHLDKAEGLVEYTAPEIIFTIEGFGIESSAIVTRWGPRSDPGAAFVSFIVAYTGNMIDFERATTPEGDRLETLAILQDNSNCSGRARDCVLLEVFRVMPTQQQIAQYARNGVFPIQIGASSNRRMTVEIPVSYFDAVNGI